LRWWIWKRKNFYSSWIHWHLLLQLADNIMTNCVPKTYNFVFISCHKFLKYWFIVNIRLILYLIFGSLKKHLCKIPIVLFVILLNSTTVKLCFKHKLFTRIFWFQTYSTQHLPSVVPLPNRNMHNHTHRICVDGNFPVSHAGDINFRIEWIVPKTQLNLNAFLSSRHIFSSNDGDNVTRIII